MVITMGCGDARPFFPGKRYLDWKLDDPAGQGIEAVRPIRDEIEHRIRGLLTELGIWTVQSGIFPENTASLTLHAKAGFRIIGTRERIGRWRDVILIEHRSPTIH